MITLEQLICQLMDCGMPMDTPVATVYTRYDGCTDQSTDSDPVLVRCGNDLYIVAEIDACGIRRDHEEYLARLEAERRRREEKERAELYELQRLAAKYGKELVDSYE